MGEVSGEVEDGQEPAHVDSDSVFDSSDAKSTAGEDTHVLKMLDRGNVEELSRRKEQNRKCGMFNRRHDYYRQTRCTTTAQEEHGALPAGVINVHDDSEDEGGYSGEQKEIAKEVQELRAAQHWINQPGWDAVREGYATSPSTGTEIDLRLDWGDVKKALAAGTGMDDAAAPVRLEETAVLRDYGLEKLDPTQRVFADRVLS